MYECDKQGETIINNKGSLVKQLSQSQTCYVNRAEQRRQLASIPIFTINLLNQIELRRLSYLYHDQFRLQKSSSNHISSREVSAALQQAVKAVTAAHVEECFYTSFSLGIQRNRNHKKFDNTRMIKIYEVIDYLFLKKSKLQCLLQIIETETALNGTSKCCFPPESCSFESLSYLMKK